MSRDPLVIFIIYSKMNKLSNNLSKLKFLNTHIKSLLAVEQKDNNPQLTPNCNYSKVKPTPLSNPRLVSISGIACKILGIDKKEVEEDPETPFVISGNKLLEGSEPISHCYCGYQFGVFAGQLGDGSVNLNQGGQLQLEM
jgi:uncharacterized protein YdiU (UPF0061 family)